MVGDTWTSREGKQGGWACMWVRIISKCDDLGENLNFDGKLMSLYTLRIWSHKGSWHITLYTNKGGKVSRACCISVIRHHPCIFSGQPRITVTPLEGLTEWTPPLFSSSGHRTGAFGISCWFATKWHIHATSNLLSSSWPPKSLCFKHH